MSISSVKLTFRGYILEQIYTIPVNEAFDLVAQKPECGCPLCVLFKKLEDDELDIILGASMMEPDIRIKTNDQGFCKKHFIMMNKRSKALPLALMMESHLAEVGKKLAGPTVLGNKCTAAISALGQLECDCYICSRIDRNLSAMTSTVVYLWESDYEFRKKFDKMPYFCLPHYRAMMEYASKKMNKKVFAELYDSAYKIQQSYLEQLSADVSWFCKKFDYRYDAEPWYNSKDSVKRAIKFISGGTEEDSL